MFLGVFHDLYIEKQVDNGSLYDCDYSIINIIMEINMKEIQPVLDLVFESSPEKEKRQTPEQLLQRQAVICWLLKKKPTGMALSVPTRISRFRAGIGAFWAKPNRKRVLHPTKTMALEIRFKRDECWPDITNKDDLLGELKQLEQKKDTIEKIIRLKEPRLRASDNLFDDIEDWNYENSRNPEYHRCLKKLEKTRRALYAGSLFEQIRSAGVVDYLYLAVPHGLVEPEELANGWGLLYINQDLTVSEVKKAKSEETTAEGKLHFIQNIAAASMRNVLFSLGINLSPSGEITRTRPPRRRTKKL